MSFGFTASAPSLSDKLDVVRIKHIMAQKKAMKRAGAALKDELRSQTEAAGFGLSRLAKTWQGKDYPNDDRPGQGPATLVYSKAPRIIDALARGATIVPVNGRRCLALPTDDTPRLRAGRAMVPREVEAKYGRKLRFVPAKSAQGSRTKGGSAVGYLIMDGLVRPKSGGRHRNASVRELAGTGRNKGRAVDSIVMFEMQTKVKMPKLFDLRGAAEGVAATVPQLIADEWS